MNHNRTLPITLALARIHNDRYPVRDTNPIIFMECLISMFCGRVFSVCDLVHHDHKSIQTAAIRELKMLMHNKGLRVVLVEHTTTHSSTD